MSCLNAVLSLAGPWGFGPQTRHVTTSRISGFLPNSGKSPDLPEKRPEIREEMDKTDEEERDNMEESLEKHTNGPWRPTYRRAGHGPALWLEYNHLSLLGRLELIWMTEHRPHLPPSSTKSYTWSPHPSRGPRCLQPSPPPAPPPGRPGRRPPPLPAQPPPARPRRPAAPHVRWPGAGGRA